MAQRLIDISSRPKADIVCCAPKPSFSPDTGLGNRSEVNNQDA
jgi:hypothetical protein